jgi:hypothetical protein
MAKRKQKSKRKRDDVTVTSVDDEEGELVTHDDLLEPQEQLSNKRHDAAELIMKKAGVEDGTSSPVNNDIDHNIREIRAILKMNAEILDRCKDFMGGTKIKDDGGSALSPSSSDDDSDEEETADVDSNSSEEEDSVEDDIEHVEADDVEADDVEAETEDENSAEEVKNSKVEWHTSFNRIAYEVVTTRARQNCTQVITSPKRTTKAFNTTPLSKLPQGLDVIIVSNNMTGKKLSSFIDFEVFFERALLLHETVLEAFLPKLKEHLMSIQVCLGEIDSWVIQEPQGNISFLEETFETKMEIPDDNVTLGRHKCSCETHDPNEICLYPYCGRKFCNHYKRRCNKESRKMFFYCEYYQLLKQCDGKGKYETSFDLTNEKEKVRLKKFLEFMASG